ncbi:MAG: HD domain-containing phosphohydrolase [Pseudomonadota bacterium]|nr:HD domain-containing phosphohydrolase [Pseudomonadota bacterium]
MAVFLDLLENAALMMALCFGQFVILRRLTDAGPARDLAQGVWFGLSAVFAMTLSVRVAPGIIFDTRSIVLALGALFGGPVAAAISMAIAVAWRLWLGGAGALIGSGVIVSCALAGLAMRQWIAGTPHRLRTLPLLLFGGGVHVLVLGWLSLLPDAAAAPVMRYLGLPYLAVMGVGTVIVGLMLRELELAYRFDSVIEESHRRYRHLFDQAEVALLEEDLGQVRRRLDELRQAGVTDLRAHLAAHPGEVARLADAVRVVRVNPAAVDLFGTGSTAALLGPIGRFFGPGAREIFIDELVAMWAGQSRIRRETRFSRADGTLIDAIISLPLPDSAETARQVPVSIVDVSAIRESERALDIVRRRLEEVLWGTDVGTWDWNVVTGETVFNERWAGIIGYRLDELLPVDIGTWEKYAHPDDLERSNTLLDDVLAGRRDFYECEARMRHRDGHWVWVLDRGKVTERAPDGQPVRMSGTHTEITARKEAEIRAARLADLRAILLRCHVDMLQAEDESDLFRLTAATLVEARGYSLIWLGLPQDDANRTVLPVASAGDTSWLDGLDVRWSDTPQGNGPSGRAIRDGIIQITRDLAEDTSFRPWAEAAAGHAFRSSAAVPVPDRTRVLAVINVYSSLPDAFDEDETALLLEFAHAFGLALEAMRLRVETQELNTELASAAMGTVSAVAATVEKRDPYTSGHQKNVAALSVAIAERLGWDRHRIEGLRLGATIHDIGKIYIPAEILNRPGRLSAPEFDMVKTHPAVGRDILKDTRFPWPILEMVAQHHERLDGSGYPAGLSGDAIIPEARIIAVADVADAMTAHRPYRPALGPDAAIAELRRGRGTAYDPAMVDACLAILQDGSTVWRDQPAA